MTKDPTYTSHNYFAHGGEELVIGGRLTFLPGASVEGAEGLFDLPNTSAQIAYVADTTATTVAALRDDLNALLAALRTAGLMALPTETDIPDDPDE